VKQQKERKESLEKTQRKSSARYQLESSQAGDRTEEGQVLRGRGLSINGRRAQEVMRGTPAGVVPSGSGG